MNSACGFRTLKRGSGHGVRLSATYWNGCQLSNSMSTGNSPQRIGRGGVLGRVKALTATAARH